jgi:hypothetical protein
MSVYHVTSAGILCRYSCNSSHQSLLEPWARSCCQCWSKSDMSDSGWSVGDCGVVGEAGWGCVRAVQYSSIWYHKRLWSSVIHKIKQWRRTAFSMTFNTSSCQSLAFWFPEACYLACSSAPPHASLIYWSLKYGWSTAVFQTHNLKIRMEDVKCTECKYICRLLVRHLN